MRKAAFHNLGCKVNAYETEAMQQQLQERGYEIVPFDDRADVYVINTCSVTNIADRKSRQMLHRARKENPQAVIVASGWPCHGMEHALSAYYDITHGEGLAIITPRWMKHILSEKTVDRFVKYGVNVFGIDPNLDRFDIANRAIEETYQFFASIGIPMHLREVGIDESRIDEMAHHVAENEGLESAWAPLTEKDIADIFRASL